MKFLHLISFDCRRNLWKVCSSYNNVNNREIAFTKIVCVNMSPKQVS